MIDKIKQLFRKEVLHTHKFEFKKYKVKMALIPEDGIEEVKKLLLNYAVDAYEKWEVQTGKAMQEIIVFLSKLKQEKKRNRNKNAK